MELIRRNTIIFDLREAPQLSILAQHNWLVNELEIPMEKLDVVDYNFYKKIGILKFMDEASFENFKEKFNNMNVPLTDEKGETHKINYKTNNDKSKRIRISQLTTCENMEEIKKYFEQFGKVKNCEWEKNKIKMGEKTFETRRGILRMDIEMANEIPSFIKYKGVTLMVTYYGQIKTCAVCSKAGHMAKECPSKAKPIIQKPTNPSYAEITENKNEWITKGKRGPMITMQEYILPQKNKLIELSDDTEEGEDDTDIEKESKKPKSKLKKQKNAKKIKISSPRSETRRRIINESEESETINEKNANELENKNAEENKTKNSNEKETTKPENEDETNADVFEAPTPNLCKSPMETATEGEYTLIRGMYPKSLLDDPDEQSMNSSFSN